MIIYSDSKDYTENILRIKPVWKKYQSESAEKIQDHLLKRLFSSTKPFKTQFTNSPLWQYAFITDHAEHSQFAILRDILRNQTNFRDGIICLAGSGQNFKGYRNRNWESLKGNLHLSIFLNPDRLLKNFHTGFTILSAVSVLQTIDAIDGLNNVATIKWVNDILIDQAKVSGVLTQTQTQGEKVTGVFLGIGLNVQATPDIKRDLFVPGATSLREHAPCNEAEVLKHLLDNISENYSILLNGGYQQLLDIYRARSIIMGKEITVYSDPAEGPSKQLASGKVTGIGENLEIYLQGSESPVTRGRVAF